MKTLIKALLAASMLMPVAAQAQDGRGEGRRGDGGRRADRSELSADVGVQAQLRAERAQPMDFGGDRQPRGDARPDRAPPAPDQRRDDRQARDGSQWRQDRGTRDDDRRDADRRPNGAAAWSRNDGWRSDRDNRRPDYRQPDYRQPGYAPNRGDPRWSGNAGYDARRNDGRWNDGRRYDDRGGTWNRGWRNDQRYDWNRNRQLNRGAYNLPRYYAPSGWGYGYRRYSVGVSLSSILFSRNYWIADPYNYRLPEAYGPYRWVRYYDDALLVDIRTGQVVDTVYDIFY